VCYSRLINGRYMRSSEQIALFVLRVSNSRRQHAKCCMNGEYKLHVHVSIRRRSANKSDITNRGRDAALLGLFPGIKRAIFACSKQTILIHCERIFHRAHLISSNRPSIGVCQVACRRKLVIRLLCQPCMLRHLGHIFRYFGAL
jgi:hypothetical protein